MLLTSAFLALPLLVSAAPAGLTFQQPTDNVPQVIDSAVAEMAAAWSVDLEDLRLIQFSADDPPV